MTEPIFGMDQCPVCGAAVCTQSDLPAHNTRCWNNHERHYCPKHNTLAMGHVKNEYEQVCSCNLREKTEEPSFPDTVDPRVRYLVDWTTLIQDDLTELTTALDDLKESVEKIDERVDDLETRVNEIDPPRKTNFFGSFLTDSFHTSCMDSRRRFFYYFRYFH